MADRALNTVHILQSFSLFLLLSQKFHGTTQLLNSFGGFSAFTWQAGGLVSTNQRVKNEQAILPEQSIQ